MRELYNSETTLGLYSLFMNSNSDGMLIKADAGGLYKWPWQMFFEMAFVFVVVNLAIRSLLIKPILSRVLLNARPLLISKFAQATLEMFSYSLFFILGARLLSVQAWAWPSSLWWHTNNISMTPNYRFFYVAYASRHLHSFFMVLIEPKRKDFLVMEVHHLVTIALVYLSYVAAYVRIGGVIMILFDIADPPLHLAKQFVYLKAICRSYPNLRMFIGILADISFVLFAILYVITRCFLYGYVVWSCTVELYEHRVGFDVPFSLQVYIERAGTSAMVGLVLTYVLAALQCIWLLSIIQGAKRLLTTGETGDGRSDSEEDEKNKTD